MLFGIVIIAQSTMDLATPEISFTAHAGGLVCGALLGLLLGGRKASERAT